MIRSKTAVVRIVLLCLAAGAWFLIRHPGEPDPRRDLRVVRVEEKAGSPDHRHGEIGCCASATGAAFPADGPDRLVEIGSVTRPGDSPVEVEGARGRILLRLEDDALAPGIGWRFGAAPRSLGGLGLYELDLGPRADLALAIEQVSALPGVLYAEPNFTARPSNSSICEADRLGPANCKNHESIHLHEALAAATPRSRIRVAVLDTGLDLVHEDLEGHVAPFAADLVNDDDTPEDILGHGTAIAGIIAATRGNELGTGGICPSAEIVGIKVSDSRGVATFANLVRGILLAVEQQCRVLNLSLGSRADSQALRDAIQFARARGVLVVAPTGNDNTNLEMVPGRYPEVLAVAATADDGDLAITTSLGFETDLGAPGEEVYTTAPGSLYCSVTGTSCATAVASGVAALVLSVNPDLTPEQVVSILRRTSRPIGALEGQFGAFDFGRLDAAAAVAQAGSDYVDAGILDVRVRPERPRPGQVVHVAARVANLGNRPLEAMAVVFEGLSAQVGTRAGGEAPRQDVEALGVGQDRWVFLDTTAPEQPATIAVGLALAPAGDARMANDRREVRIETTAGDVHDLSIAGIRVEDASLAEGRIRFTVAVENRGNSGATPMLAVRVTGDDDREYWADQAPLGDLAAGTSTTADFTWAVPDPSPIEKLAIEMSVAGDSADAEPANDRAQYLFFLPAPDAEKARLQYEQGEDIDVIGDAPFRLEATRPYVPVMIFVPDQGGRGRERYLELEETTIKYLRNPTDSGTVIYRDTHGAPPSTVHPGTYLVDEDGKRMGGLDLFGDDRLKERGRHNFLRFPLAAIDSATPPPAPVARYVDVRVKWKFHRTIFYFFPWVSRGSHHTVLRVLVTPHGLPQLPSGGHYFDAHFHTIAEWCHADPFRIFAERKAHGGPIQMIQETAWAIGLTGGVNDIRDKVITTDHNCFFWNQVNPNLPETDPDWRVPYGPTSPARSLRPDGTLKTEWERFADLFGVTAGEEISFSQGQLAGIVPIGAHMLSHRGQHFDGPWHGGSEFTKWIGEGGPLHLDTVLHDLAKSSRTENRHAFTYAAHPFSGQGWSDENVERALGLTGAWRNDRYVHAEGTDFVFKGFQILNGRAARSVPSSDIDFEDMNPWANADWQKGDEHWDKTDQNTLAEWHDAIATNLDYAFAGAKDRRFVRKVFGEAGTDAHGDFNFSTGRAATLLKFSATYALDSNAWGMVRTYAIPDGKAGSTAGERHMQAMADGNTLMTDGPLVVFEMDSDSRFDSTRLAWHDRTHAAENADGRMGGDGTFDGGLTMLVRRGSPDTLFRYWYANTPEFGTNGGRITHLKIYRDRPGQPNPTATYRAKLFWIFTSENRKLVSVGNLAPTAPGTWLVEPIDPSMEGTIQTPTALALGAFTGVDPDPNFIGPDDHRCYTNPIYTVPVDVKVQVLQTAGSVIPVGGLSVQLTFPYSMAGADPKLEVKALDAAGNSTDGSQPPISTIGRGAAWASSGGVTRSVFSATNDQPIPLTGAAYPAAGQVTFVVYTRAAPVDLHGNALNAIASTITLPQSGGGGGGAGPGGGGGPGGGAGGSGGEGEAPPAEGGETTTPGTPGETGTTTPTTGTETPGAPSTGTETPSIPSTGTGTETPSTPSTGTPAATASSAPAAPVAAAPAPSSGSGSADASQPPAPAKKKDEGPAGISGCFIATASWDEVGASERVVDRVGEHRLTAERRRDLDVLRAFRDRELETNAPGRAFVAAYYEHGPAAAAWLREHPSARGPVRFALSLLVLLASILLGRAPLEALALVGLVAFALARRRLGRTSSTSWS